MRRELFDTPDALETPDQQRIVKLPPDMACWEAINACLYELTDPENWQPGGAKTPQECAEYFEQWYVDFLDSLSSI